MLTADQIRDLHQAKHDADLAAEYFADHMCDRAYDTSTALIAAYIDSARRFLAELAREEAE